MKDRNKDLQGKVAIVTGAGAKGGLGFVIAQTLAQAGAQVVITGRRAEELEQVAGNLQEQGLAVRQHLLNIAEEDSVEALLAFTRQTFGRLDTLVNNAAMTSTPQDKKVTEMTVEQWDASFATNARGTMLMCKHALPLMVESGGGSIVNVSSGTSLAADMQFTSYGSSKGAINTLTRYVATQYGKQGVRCNALIVGLVRTAKMERTLPKPIVDLFVANHLSPRLGESEDVAEATRFLATDHSAWITGQAIGVDGGVYAHVPTLVGMAELAARLAPS